MKKGFTLLELLLVVAILAILAAAIGPQFVYSARDNLEVARRDRFAANYQSCILAANMYLLASNTQMIIRNGGYDTFAMNTGGLKLLTASGTLTRETCMYENNAGLPRYFAMKVNDGVSATSIQGNASVSIQLSSTDTTLTVISGDAIGGYTYAGPMETALSTQEIHKIWESMKSK
jgi:prepilin-type N-terminal cleavage/methylation domain-containing protein